MTSTPPASTCRGPRPWPWRCKGSALWALRRESGSPFWGRYWTCPVGSPPCPSLGPRPSPPPQAGRGPGVRPRPPGVRADTCSVRQVHLAMVRYHEAGRFCGKDGAWDRASAMFHLQHAADLGELEAIVGLGLMCWQLPHLILPDISLQVSGPGSRRPGRPVSPHPVPEAHAVDGGRPRTGTGLHGAPAGGMERAGRRGPQSAGCSLGESRGPAVHACGPSGAPSPPDLVAGAAEGRAAGCGRAQAASPPCGPRGWGHQTGRRREALQGPSFIYISK